MRRRRYEIADAELNGLAEQLVARARTLYGAPGPQGDGDAEYARELVVTAVRLLADGAARADLKLVNSAVKELRHAFRVFAPYENVRKVAVFGSARTTREHPDWFRAEHFARRVVEEGWMVITGAGHGIMGAAQVGAGRDGSFGVNIQLPFEQQANEVIAGDPKLMNFRYFFSRKVVFVKEAHAFALFPGGFGTHDEGFEALTLMQTGKSEMLPVVFVDTPGGSYWKDWEQYVATHLRDRGLVSEDDLSLFLVTDDVEEAVREILGFYCNYHSSRYVGELLVLRVHRAPDAEELEALNRDFGDILTGGRIEVSAPLPEESGEFPEHPRVVLRLDRRNVGRLRRLIDRLNDLVAEDRASPREAVPREIVPARIPADADVEMDASGEADPGDGRRAG